MKKTFKKIQIFSLLFVFLFLGVLEAGAVYSDSSSQGTSAVNSITLKGSGSEITWSVDGYSKNGFKVVWSKNENPTYPTRSGDKYHYYNDPSKNSDSLTAFTGSGTYYVRVCEYLSGTCGIYSNQSMVVLEADEEKTEEMFCTLEYDPVCGKDGKTYSNKCFASVAGVGVASEGECKKDEEIEKIEQKANYLYEEKLDKILLELNEIRSLVKEQQVQIKYLSELKNEVMAISSKVESMINSFIAYGVDENTKRLGAGERAAVIHSFKHAFGKLPETEDDLTDAIKIANGRWPSEKSEEAENKAKENFSYIYKREANTENQNDNAAVTIMAYGLRQRAENRNLNSEREGAKIFKAIYGHLPSTTEEWNILQAITYSGAKR